MAEHRLRRPGHRRGPITTVTDVQRDDAGTRRTIELVRDIDGSYSVDSDDGSAIEQLWPRTTNTPRQPQSQVVFCCPAVAASIAGQTQGPRTPEQRLRQFTHTTCPAPARGSGGPRR